MTGMIFGAGIFALPYAFLRGGLFWGIINFCIAFLLLAFLHIWFGEIAYYTKGKHRFTGYVEIFLGKNAKNFAFLATIASYYGSLLVYGLLGGIFLSNLFGVSQGFNFAGILSIIFFAAGGMLVLFGVNKIASINFYLIIPLFLFVVYLFVSAAPMINVGNFLEKANGDWFLSYGVWLFALCGFAAIPETRDIFSGYLYKNFKKTILISVVLSALFYFIFIAAVWGVSGKYTTPDALSGLAGALGKNMLLVGSFIGFLAVFTSYIALAEDMKNIFIYDYKRSIISAWFFTAIPPVVLFLAGIHDFVKILGIIGSLGLGVLGIFIVFIRRRLRKMIFDGNSEVVLHLMEGNEKNLKAKWMIVAEFFVLAGVFTGVICELWSIFS